MNPQYYGAAAEYHKPPGGGVNIKRLLTILGLVLGVLAIIGIGFTLVSNLSKGPQEDFTSLISRASGLQDLLQEEQPAIRNGDLRKVNSEANILLISDINTLNTAFTTTFGASSMPKDGIPAETDEAVAGDLKNATSNGNFDRTYVGIVRDKLTNVYQQAKKVSDALSGTAKENVRAFMADLEILDDRFKALGL